MEDSGVFAVIAENRGGRAKCSANLVVEEKRRVGRGGVIPPSFLSTAQDTTVKSGSLARFDAKIAGTKPLDVYWLKVRILALLSKYRSEFGARYTSIYQIDSMNRSYFARRLLSRPLFLETKSDPGIFLFIG